MKKTKRTPDLKGRKFTGISYSKIKRKQQQPRQRIRWLLRSFLPVSQPKH